MRQPTNNKMLYWTWFLAAVALIFAIMAMDIDAQAQGEPTPTPTEDYYTCIWIDDRWVCMDAEPMVTPTLSATPLPAPTVAPTPTDVQSQPISQCVIINCAYLPIVAAGEVVTGDTR